MDATIAGFEDACDRLQSPATNQAAQRTLMDFLERPAAEVLEVSRAVLGAPKRAVVRTAPALA